MLPTRQQFNNAWNQALQSLVLHESADGDVEGLYWTLEDWWSYLNTFPEVFIDTMSRAGKIK